MDATPDPHVPIDERLLDVRTPAELAFSPDGSKIAFALHATVATSGRTHRATSTSSAEMPARPARSRAERGATGARRGRRMDLGSRSSPTGSPRVTSSRTRWSSAPSRSSQRASTAQRRRSRGPSSGDRLLVLAADPGCYGLDWSARAVRGAEPTPDPSVIRPSEARRRLFEIDLASGDVSRSRSAGHERVGVRRGPRRRRGRARLGGSEHGGWYRSVVARLDLAERTAETLYRPTWSLEGLALSPDGRRAAVVEGYSSDPGLLSGSAMIVDLSDGTTTDPWPGLQTVGLVEWIDDDSLWYARATGPGRRAGGSRSTAPSTSVGGVTRSSATR